MDALYACSLPEMCFLPLTRNSSLLKFSPTSGSVKQVQSEEREKKEKGTSWFLLKLNKGKNKPFSSY